LALFVKPNTILPFGHNKTKPDYDYLQDITYHIFELEEDTTIELPIYDVKNEVVETVKLVKEGNEMIINRTSSLPASFILRNIDHVTESSVPTQSNYLGLQFLCDENTQEIKIQL
jgi:alpha-D-xyloside xylohydrolase